MIAKSFPDRYHFFMRRYLPILTIAALLLARAPSGAQIPVVGRLGDYVESLRVQAGIPGLAVSIVGPDDVIWEQSFGRQDAERSIATRTDTPFHLDGLTQIVTAAALRRRGRLSRRSHRSDQANGPMRTRRCDRSSRTSGAPDNPIFA
jgi:hypothetical protein